MLRQVVIISAGSKIFSARHCWLQCPKYFPNKLIEFPPLSGLEVKEKREKESFILQLIKGHFLGSLKCKLKREAYTKLSEKVRELTQANTAVFNHWC